jgi:hypothetical protein
VSIPGRDERGQATIEFMGMLFYIFLAGLAAWQILLVAMTVTSAENAARAASRANSRMTDGEEAGMGAMPEWLRDDTSVSMSGERATVTVRVPILVPGVSAEDLTISKSAQFPAG